METVGLIMGVFGAVFAAVAAFGLTVDGEERDEGRAGEWVDVFLLGGFFSLIFGLGRGISNAFRDRDSSAFVLAVLFLMSVGVSVLGLVLWRVF